MAGAGARNSDLRGRGRRSVTPSVAVANPRVMSEETLAEARRRFFASSGFASDGGYDDSWAHAEFGSVPYTVPNTRIRAEALRIHDLHHPLTGYRADWRGEAQISAWELGSGGAASYPYAWFIALFGLLTGLIGAPQATWRAFQLGRSTQNLYGDPDPMRWLAHPVEEVRRELRGTAAQAPRRRDALFFLGWSVLAAALAVIFALGSPLLVLAALSRRLAYEGPCRLCCLMQTPGAAT